MYSYSHHLAPADAGNHRHPPFADVLETIKSAPSMRMMLDGQAGFARLSPAEQHEHRTKCMLWDYLRRTQPHEYARQYRERCSRNAERFMALLRIHDPLFATTWHMLTHMLEMLPGTAEYLVRKGAHDNASIFLKLYEEMREWAEEVEQRKHRRKRAHESARAPRPRDAAAEREAKRQADMAALAAKTKACKGEEGDLLKYLELAIPDDHPQSETEGGW